MSSAVGAPIVAGPPHPPTLGNSHNLTRNGMNSYLAIAAKVLEQARQPLSARQILQAAYQSHIVPGDLYGKTQHKTLHARLAEDIRRNISKSDFYRTEPGRFYLRKFLNEPTRPRQIREYRAPVRADQLKNFYALCFERGTLASIAESHGARVPLRALYGCDHRYIKLSTVGPESREFAMRILVVLKRSDQVLVHRSFSQFGDRLDGTISLGIVGFVKRRDKTLFARDEYGLEEAASRALAQQLYLPYELINDLELAGDIAEMPCLIDLSAGGSHNSFVVALIYNCPTDTPVDAALSAIAEAKWEDRIDRINNLDDFDIWSQSMLQQGYLTSNRTQ